MPAQLLVLGELDRVAQWTHALAISGVWLHKVDQVNSIGCILASVLNSEKEPLSVAMSPIIVL